jgi:hypothetical protein
VVGMIAHLPPNMMLQLSVVLPCCARADIRN